MLKFTEAIREALDLCLAEHPAVYVLGLGTPDPKGIFGTTLGLREKYGNDRQRISQEQFKLMKEHGVPLMPGGCLLTFLQLPIWIALYGMLQTNFDLRHASFLWIDDLSQADHLVEWLPGVRTIPMVPNALQWLNLLPLLMTATWFFASKATMTPPADEQQAQMHQAVLEVFGQAKPPHEVAELVHDAVLARKFWIFTDEVYTPAIHERLDSIRNATDPPARGSLMDVYFR